MKKYTSCNRKNISYSDTFITRSLRSNDLFYIIKTIYTYAIFLNHSNYLDVSIVSAASCETRGSAADARPRKRRKCLLTMAAGTCQFA